MIINRLFRTFLVIVAALIFTPSIGILAIVAGLLRVKDRPNGIYDFVPRKWSRIMLWAAGAKVTVHGMDKISDGEPHIFVSNHLSWFDIPSLAGYLPRYKFVAKAELFKIPVFGPAIRAVGMIPIERENRKAAFESLKVAAEKIRQGNSVVIYPEGTRGTSYALRPFKKGPFVLAIEAGVPVVPVLLHGTMELFGKGSKSVRPGPIDIHLLEPIPTAGLEYDDREKLANTVRDHMAAALEHEYGIKSPNVENSRAE